MARRHSANAADTTDHQEAASVAETLSKDFRQLISIFDRQLANASIARSGQYSRISDARHAAERGLALSQELVELLRTGR